MLVRWGDPNLSAHVQLVMTPLLLILFMKNRYCPNVCNQGDDTDEEFLISESGSDSVVEDDLLKSSDHDSENEVFRTFREFVEVNLNSPTRTVLK